MPEWIKSLARKYDISPDTNRRWYARCRRCAYWTVLESEDSPQTRRLETHEHRIARCHN